VSRILSAVKRRSWSHVVQLLIDSRIGPSHGMTFLMVSQAFCSTAEFGKTPYNWFWELLAKHLELPRDALGRTGRRFVPAGFHAVLHAKG
jgi:hypothetical protein